MSVMLQNAYRERESACTRRTIPRHATMWVVRRGLGVLLRRALLHTTRGEAHFSDVCCALAGLGHEDDDGDFVGRATAAARRVILTRKSGGAEEGTRRRTEREFLQRAAKFSPSTKDRRTREHLT